MQTTLNRLREFKPCTDRWAVLLRNLGKTGGDDSPLLIRTIFSLNGFDDALWALRAINDSGLYELREYAFWCVDRLNLNSAYYKASMMYDMAKQFHAGQVNEDDIEYFNYTMSQEDRTIYYTNPLNTSMVNNCVCDIRTTIDSIVNSSIIAEGGLAAPENIGAAREAAREARIAQLRTILGL